MSRQNKENKYPIKTSNIKNDKPYLKKGIRFMVIALPLLFISPIVITIGFKAISKNNSYFMLVLGCVLAIFTIILVIQGIRNLLKSLFDS